MVLVGIQDASKHLAISISTLYRLTSQKRIPFYKVGGRVLFDIARLDEWLSGHAVEPERGMAS